MTTKPFLVLFDKNTMLLKLEGLKDVSSGGDFMNSATVSALIKDSADANVGSAIALFYVSGSNGNYEGSVPHTVGLTVGGDYTVEITATQGGLQGFFKPTLIVQERTTG